MSFLPVKIAVVIPKYGLAGGAEKFAAELTTRIARDPHYDVHVFANKWQDGLPHVTFHKVPVISFPKFLTTFSFAWFANRRISKEQFDIIHTHERIFAADLFTMHGTPHRYWIKQVRHKTMSLFDHVTAWVESRLVANRRCRHYIAVSQLAAQTYYDTYNFADLKISVMPPGVDLERFSSNSSSELKNKVRARYGISANDFLLLFVGMNFELKGLDHLLTAMAKARSGNESRPIKLLVVGKGDQKKYRKLSRAYGIEDDVVLAGVVTESIEDIYGSADALIMLSEFDTFGMTVLEAMASGLPVIVSDKVGAKDMVSEGKNGFVVKRDDITMISQKILELLDEGRWERMSVAAVDEARKHTWEDLAGRMKDLYAEIISEKQGSRSAND